MHEVWLVIVHAVRYQMLWKGVEILHLSPSPLPLYQDYLSIFEIWKSMKTGRFILFGDMVSTLIMHDQHCYVFSQKDTFQMFRKMISFCSCVCYKLERYLQIIIFQGEWNFEIFSTRESQFKNSSDTWAADTRSSIS